MIIPSDCDLEYHFGPKVLEYGRKKLYLVRFPQLAFVMTSPLPIAQKVSPGLEVQYCGGGPKK